METAEISTPSAEELAAEVGTDCRKANELIIRYQEGCGQAKDALVKLLGSDDSFIAAIAYCGLLNGPDYPKEDFLMETLSSFKKDPKNRDTISQIVACLRRYKAMYR